MLPPLSELPPLPAEPAPAWGVHLSPQSLYSSLLPASMRHARPSVLPPLPRYYCRHECSTFDFLMALNTLAGRTYNDLNQCVAGLRAEGCSLFQRTGQCGAGRPGRGGGR